MTSSPARPSCGVRSRSRSSRSPSTPASRAASSWRRFAPSPEGQGLNAANGEYGDMMKFGVVDPAKVTRSALQNAASIAALFLTTEAVVAEKPEKTPAACRAAAACPAGTWTSSPRTVARTGAPSPFRFGGPTLALRDAGGACTEPQHLRANPSRGWAERMGGAPLSDSRAPESRPGPSCPYARLARGVAGYAPCRGHHPDPLARRRRLWPRQQRRLPHLPRGMP